MKLSQNMSTWPRFYGQEGHIFFTGYFALRSSRFCCINGKVEPPPTHLLLSAFGDIPFPSPSLRRCHIWMFPKATSQPSQQSQSDGSIPLLLLLLLLLRIFHSLIWLTFEGSFGSWIGVVSVSTITACTIGFPAGGEERRGGSLILGSFKCHDIWRDRRRRRRFCEEASLYSFLAAFFSLISPTCRDFPAPISGIFEKQERGTDGQTGISGRTRYSWMKSSPKQNPHEKMSEIADQFHKVYRIWTVLANGWQLPWFP